MEPNVEFIDMPLNFDHYKRLSDKEKLKFWLITAAKLLGFLLIATLIVAAIALSCTFLLNPANEVKRDKNKDKPKVIEDGHCGLNWMAYKDEKCFRILGQGFKTFDEAVEGCVKLENGSTLPVIHSKEEQDFLSNYLFAISRKVENFWIGAKVGRGNTFRWIDNSDLTFTNWVSEGPRKREDYCVQMQAEGEFLGKWIDEHCQEKNFVVCQKVQSWSVERMQKIVITARKYYDDLLEKANNKIVEQARALEEVNQKIDKTQQNIVPIGFVYAQLPNETSPQEIWPSMVWTDVSATYAGVFFRVDGGDAAEFGYIQQQNAPRLAEVFVGDSDRSKTQTQFQYNHGITIPEEGWSAGINSGTVVSSRGVDVYTQFQLSTGEVRPRNMAIRIWKRVA